MLGIEHVWKKAKYTAMDSKSLQESYLVIYSGKYNVVDDIVDAYLDVRQSFKRLTLSQGDGDHAIFAAPDLTTATDMLANLRRRGLVGKAQGSACILQASLDVFSLNAMIDGGKDFRPFLSEIGNSVAATQRVRSTQRVRGIMAAAHCV